MLKTAVEWGIIERVPCAIKLLKAPKTTASFYDFEEYERLVEAARTDVLTLSGRPARGRSRPAVRRDHGAGVVQRRPAEAATLRRPVRVEGPRDDAQGWTAQVRAVDTSGWPRRYSTRGICAARACSATERRSAVTQKAVQVMLRRPARRANVKPGVHILRHTFCSHLAMRGAPARAIQELAGHQDLSTTQRYMHLSPAAARCGDQVVGDGNRGDRAVEK